MRVRSLSAGLLALTLVASSCGSDDDVETEPTDVPAETGAPIETTPSTDAAPSTDSAPSTDAAPSTDETRSTGAADGLVGTGSMSPEVASLIDESAEATLPLLEQNGGTALYFAVSDPEQGDYVAAYGDAGVDGPAATTDDSFRIGSITKSFTAAIILQLVDEGELSLDDTVEDVHPGLAVDFPDYAPITIEQLLEMTSGIPDFANVPDSVISGVFEDPDRVWEPYDLIEIGVSGDIEEPGTPGYSSTNYIALQLIAEELTGSAIQDLVDERLVAPDDLGNISYPPNDDTALPEPFTRGYVAGACVDEFAADGVEVDDGFDTSDLSASATQGAGQMTSDISSLLNWAATMSGSDTLSDELAATRMESLNRVATFDYGLGIFRAGTNWWGHTGEALGWEAVSFHDPETGVSVAVAGNGCGGQFLSYFGLIDAIYPDGKLLETTIAAVTEAATAPAETDTTETDTTEPATTDGATGGDSDGDSGGDSSGGEGTDAGDDSSAASGTASGTVVMTFAATTVEATVVECTVAEPDIQLIAEGEAAEIQLFAVGGGDTDVAVSGAFEFEGTGTAAFDPDTSGIDQGNVTVTGSGAAADDSTPVGDFTVDARIQSC